MKAIAYGLIIAGVLVLAATAWAKPANTECRVSDGTQIYIVANNGNVMIQWDNGEWNEAYSKVEGDVISVIQIAPNGMAVVSWNYKDNSAYVVIKNDKTGKRLEKHARCWFK